MKAIHCTRCTLYGESMLYTCVEYSINTKMTKHYNIIVVLLGFNGGKLLKLNNFSQHVSRPFTVSDVSILSNINKVNL